MKYSIVIPTLGSIQNNRKLLASLASLKNIQDAEILIVQNPPSNRLQSLLEEFSNLNLQLLQSAPGVNCARNLGLEKSNGKLVFFLDDDCRITAPDFLRVHELAHNQTPWAYAIGGFYQSSSSSKLTDTYCSIQRQWLETNTVSSNGECNTLLGGHFSIKRLLEPSARFDESIKYGGSETEFFFRLKKSGLRFKLLSLAVEHDPQISIFSFVRKAYLQGKTHRRMQKQGIFPQPSWIHWSSFKPNFYHWLFMRFFHMDYSMEGFKRIFLFWKRPLSKWHQNICFYLSNRDLF